MDTRTDAEPDPIVGTFTRWFKALKETASRVDGEHDVRVLEQALRDGGRSILQALFEQLLQSIIDSGQESLRTCPDCGGRRRHQGVRERRLGSCFGSLTLSGIYWKCPACPSRQHSVDLVGQEELTLLMKDMVLLAGVSSTSFDKGQVVCRHLLGVDVDDEAIRLRCLREGYKPRPVPARIVEPGHDLIGSCDGTMVNTREDRWRELKAMRFEHEHGVYAEAYLEKTGSFSPRLKQVAEMLGQAHAGRCVFVSDCAGWIDKAVAKQLPKFRHVADYFHAAQHVHRAAEEIYGKEHPDARKWSRSISRRLREYGAARLVDKLRRLTLYYADLKHQRAVLDLCRYLNKHASKMDYGRFQREQIPIDSGGMESFCKQLGLRMKGPGMRWSKHNVSAMANLVCRWATDPHYAFTTPIAA